MDKFLRQFIEVATFNNVSHAANKLCLSQPTLTHNMKKLEESLGVVLFERLPNGIKLTSYGELLLEQARMMQRIYDNTLIKMEIIKVRQEQSLRIGTGHAWWFIFMKAMFVAHRQRYSNANMHFELGNHLWLMDLLLSGDIDLFIGHEIEGLNPKTGMLFLPLFSTVNSIYARRDHPLFTLNRPLTLEQLLPYPYMELTPDALRHQHLVEDLQPKKHERKLLHLTDRILYSANSMMAALDMLQDSDAVMPYPTSMAPWFSRYNIASLPMTRASKREMVGVYIMAENAETPHISQAIALIRQHVQLHLHELERDPEKAPTSAAKTSTTGNISPRRGR
nr:LysR family transcriptional regulator [Pantoea sp. 201603H]